MNRESYNKITDKWNEARKKMPLNRCIVDFIARIKQNGKILDIGCGTGYPISKYLSEQGFTVTGINGSESMIEMAIHMELPNATFYLCDFFDFQPTEKYDGIVAFDSFFHFPIERQIEIYSRISDWMSIGAYILFTHGKQEGEIRDCMFGEEFYYSSLDTLDVHRLLVDNGFIIELSVEDYKEMGNERDLLIVAKKTR